MLSLMLFLDCSSDHWKYEKLLLCYCKAYGENSRTAVHVRMHIQYLHKFVLHSTEP